MARNGSGTYNLSQPAFTPGSTILSSAVNSDFSDIASALTTSVCSDGQTTITGQLQFPNGSAAAPSHTFGSDKTTGLYYIGTKKLGISAGGILGAVLDLTNQGTGQNGNLLYLNTPSGTAYLCPVGTVADFCGSTAPSGWLLVYGQNISRTGYPELFNVVGTTFGSGDGSTTFGMPDCRGRTSYGQDNMGGSAANRITVAGGNFDGTGLGNTGGGQNYTLLQANLPAFKPAITITDPGHAHTVTQNANSNNSSANSGAGPTIPTSSNAAITVNSNTTGITAALTSNLGSGTATPIINPAIIFNKIIFAGRP